MSAPKQWIRQAWVIEGTITTEAPMIIGTGRQSEETDILIQRDEEGSPFIPATSLIGCLREYWYSRYSKDNHPPEVNRLWGYSDRAEGMQSGIILWDLPIHTPSNDIIEIRDGVKINSKRGIAEPGMKYDYETVRKGIAFDFHLEAMIWDGENSDVIESVLTELVEALKNGKIRVGAMGTKGFGKITLKNTNARLYQFDKIEDVASWLSKASLEAPGQLPQRKLDFIKEESTLSLDQREFVIKAEFSLRTSLIIRSKDPDRDSETDMSPDGVHLRSGDKPILPGTSLKGAIRARAERILNTLCENEEKAKKALNNLMGYVSEENERDKKKSRVYVDEQEISKEMVLEMIHGRIKIDRFTGGALGTALFNYRPLWPKDGKSRITLTLRVKDCATWEAGLMMLVIKDLWTGDLPLGGEKSVGRGILKGVSAELRYGDNEYKIEQNQDTLIIDGIKEELEKWVHDLVSQMRGVQL